MCTMHTHGCALPGVEKVVMHWMLEDSTMVQALLGDEWNLYVANRVTAWMRYDPSCFFLGLTLHAWALVGEDSEMNSRCSSGHVCECSSEEMQSIQESMVKHYLVVLIPRRLSAAVRGAACFAFRLLQFSGSGRICELA